MSQPPSSARLLPNGLRVMHMRADQDGLSLLVEPSVGVAGCPVCGSPLARIHSRYTRKASDLPWRGIAVKLEVRFGRVLPDSRCFPTAEPRRPERSARVAALGYV